MAYIINLDEYTDVGTHSITLFCNKNNIVYFVSFGVEHVLKEIKKFIAKKNIISNTFQIQGNDSIMCGCFALDLLILC